MNVTWHSDHGDVPTAIKSAVEGAIDRSRILGLCLGISLNGRRYYLSAGQSLVDSTESIAIDTRFNLGCLSKVLGAAVVLEMCNERILDLRAPIGQYLHEFSGHPKGEKITVAHLISHTPGYMAINAIVPGSHSTSREAMCEHVRNADQLFEPGQVFSYQNSAAALLGEIVLRRTGVTLPQMIERHLLGQGRHSFGNKPSRGQEERRANGHIWSRLEGRFIKYGSALEIDDLWQPAMCSQISISVGHFLPFAEALLGPNGVGEPATGELSRTTVVKMHEQVVIIPRGSEGAASGLVPVGYGHGLGRYARGLFGHDSTMPGEATGFRVAPGARCAVVVGLNSDRGAPRQAIFDAVFDALSVSGKPEPVSSLPFTLAELEGVYMGRERLTVDVRRAGRELLLSMGYEARGLVKMLGMIDFTGYFQPRKSAGVITDLRERICYTFFADPVSGSPCLMMGVSALKRMRPA